MGMQCRKPLALAGCSHRHKEIRGSMKLADGSNVHIAKWSARYCPEESTVLAKIVKWSCLNRPARRFEEGPVTELMEMAKASRLYQSL